MKLFFFCTLAAVLDLVHGVDVRCQPRYPIVNEDVSCEISLTEPVTVKTGEKLNIMFHLSFDSIKEIRFVADSDNRSQLSTVLSEIFEQMPNIEIFELHATVNELNEGDFEKAGKLKNLTIGDQLKTIPTGVFSSAKNLDSLKLSINQIAEIEDNAFSELHALLWLDLEYNNLKIIKQNTFNGLGKLEVLDLESNQIETIEENALNLPNLKLLYVGNNRLTSLSDHLFATTPLLQTFKASFNQINHIGKSLYGLKNLEALSLSNNKLTDADLVAFSQMEALKQLYLYEIDLTSDNISRIDVKEPSKSVLSFLSLANNGLANNEDWKKFALYPELETIVIVNTEYSKIDLGDKILRQQFPNLKKVIVSSTKWDCGWLKIFIESSKNDGIDIVVMESSNVNGFEIFGIGCA